MVIDHIPVSTLIRDEIKSALARKSLPHAVLFSGQDGGAQLPLALFAAKSLLCNETSEGLACGVCSSCMKVDRSIHPDLNLSFPVPASRETAENAIEEWREMMDSRPFLGLADWYGKLEAGDLKLNISAKEIHRIERNIRYKSFEGVGKVLLIWLPEFLGGEGNKLLKSIEEPPPGTHIFLVTNEVNKILPTIISRCRLIRIPRPGPSALSSWLTGVKGFGETEAVNAAAVSEGNVNVALRQLEGDNQLQIDRDFIAWSRIAFSGDPSGVLDFIDEFLKTGDRESVRNLFRFGLFYFNQVLLKKMNVQQEGLRDELSASAGKMASFLSVSAIEQICESFEKYLVHIDRNASVKILLTYATVQLGRDLRVALKRSRESARA